MTVMKHILSAAVAAMLLASPALAQQPLFQNFGTLIDPSPIDAQAIQNFGTITSGLGAINTGLLLFDTESTRSFTNEFTGIMRSQPGFQFDLIQGYYRAPSSNFVNSGSISATLNLKVYSAYIENSGLLSADTGGRVLLQGNTINLVRGSVRAGDGSFGNLGGYSQGGNSGFGTNYTNPTTLIDDYWGTGNGGLLNLGSLNNGGSSPNHLVALRTGGVPRLTSVNVNPQTTGPLFPGYSFFVITNYIRLDANNVNGVVQMVFVQTNLFDSPDTRVFFHNNSGGLFNTRAATVQFAIPDVDNITRRPYTRYYRFTDNSALSPNYNLFQNSVRPGYFRPGNFNLVRSDTPFFNNPTEATPFDPNYIFTTVNQFVSGRYLNQFPNHQYSAWQFSVNSTSFGGGGFGSATGGTSLSDFTNAPGRVEIVADQLNLRETKIRADNLVSIKATNLVDSFGVDIDALHINLELLSPTGTVVLSNMFPTTVRRMNGSVSAWSATWAVDQFVTNNAQFPNSSNVVHYQYHMLVLDNLLVTNRASSLENFCIQATNVFLADDFTINKCFQLLATCLTIETNASIVLTGTNINSTAVNLPNLLCLTNRGSFFVPELGNFGFDRAFPYQYIVNHGLFSAGSLLFRSDHFINTNRLFAFNGPIFIEAKSNLLSGGFLSASTDVRFSGEELRATNSTITAAGAISLSLSTRVSDLGRTNTWSCEQGIKLLKKPSKGDLLATKVNSSALAGATVFHDWAGENRGNSAVGFLNNAALGRLVLDGATNSTFVFSGTDFTGTNGMYIQYLELLNNATNFASVIQIDPNVIVYFTDSNLPADKLTNVFGGRLVWVTTYSGPPPLSISVALPSGKTTQINSDLLPSGLLNPSFNNSSQTGFTISRVTVVNLPPLTTVISWPGEANTTYTVEYTTNLASPNWLTLLTTFAPADGTVTVGDQAGSPGQRFYRVRYNR